MLCFEILAGRFPLSPQKSETQSESANYKRSLLIFALKSGQKRDKVIFFGSLCFSLIISSVP